MTTEPRPRTHYARGQQRRADVIAATIEVIADRGIEGVTHRSVAAAAGVSLSTTSYFFGSLDELVGAAVTVVAEEVAAQAEEVAAQAVALQGASTAERAEQVLALLAAPRPRRLVAQFEAYLATTRRPELVEAVRRIVQVYDDTAVTVLEAVGAEQPALAARQFVALLDGLALQRIAHPREDDAEVRADALRRLASTHLDLPLRPGGGPSTS